MSTFLSLLYDALNLKPVLLLLLVQLKASGLRPSDLTYIDKVEYVDALRRKHGYKPRKK